MIDRRLFSIGEMLQFIEQLDYCVYGDVTPAVMDFSEEMYTTKVGAGFPHKLQKHRDETLAHTAESYAFYQQQCVTKQQEIEQLLVSCKYSGASDVPQDFTGFRTIDVGSCVDVFQLYRELAELLNRIKIWLVMLDMHNSLKTPLGETYAKCTKDGVGQTNNIVPIKRDC
jgi:hypothetical protein